MRNKSTSIPVNSLGGEFDSGVVIEKFSVNELPVFEEWAPSERHDRNSFFLIEKGSVSIEIDFQTYHLKSPCLVYMHPNQVHRLLKFEDVTVTCWAVNTEKLNSIYIQSLEDITPATPLTLNGEMFNLISETASICFKLSEQKSNKLHPVLLKDSCNVLVGLVISMYTKLSQPIVKPSRFEIITKNFKIKLELDYIKTKRPVAYAQKLNISVPYLNECVRNITGHSASYHIQQRVILEAKRLLFHSNKSVKEIAIQLGYDDQSYFSRLFIKVTGITALAFRNKNLD